MLDVHVPTVWQHRLLKSRRPELLQASLGIAVAGLITHHYALPTALPQGAESVNAVEEGLQSAPFSADGPLWTARVGEAPITTLPTDTTTLLGHKGLFIDGSSQFAQLEELRHSWPDA